MRSNLLAYCHVFVQIFLSISVLLPLAGHAQTDVDEPTEPSYHERWRVFKSGGGTKEADPNVYVYTPEFAKRFQMPFEWESTELKGVDAVAYRVVPSPYKTCGWGGDPKACRTNEVRCEMDLYFDHKRNPLPWDERYPEILSDYYGYSSRFIPGNSRKLRLPKHPNSRLIFGPSPFVEPKTGQDLGWQTYSSNNSVSGWVGLVSYDKEIFRGMSLITLGGGCGQPPDELFLGSSLIYKREIASSQALYKRVVVPVDWRSRVNETRRESKERDEAFFKREGEKAMKALRDSPVPSKSVVPLQ